jgi:hypothetical protein
MDMNEIEAISDVLKARFLNDHKDEVADLSKKEANRCDKYGVRCFGGAIYDRDATLSSSFKIELCCIKCGTRAYVWPSEERSGNVPICCGHLMKTTTDDLRRTFPDGIIGCSAFTGEKLD